MRTGRPTTPGPSPALDRLLGALRRILRDESRNDPPEPLLVAFSGGPDSTALLLAACRLRDDPGEKTRDHASRLDLHAAHVDHRLDPGSGARAEHARRLARELGVPFHLLRLEPARVREHPGGLEAGARAERYRHLENLRGRLGARFLLTAHHADDQAETVVLRLLFGSGLIGLGGIAPRRGSVLRPFLALPRRDLAAALRERRPAGRALEPVDDPTNRDPAPVRNRVRHLLLPRLAANEPVPAAELRQRLAALAAAARRADAAITRRLETALQPGREDGGAVVVPRRALAELPDALLPQALAFVGRLAGARHPPAAAVRRELRRQLAAGGRVGCDCGGGWRLEGDGRALRLRPRLPPIGDFSYTLRAPGRIAIDELGIIVHIERRDVASWMFRNEPRRAALAAAFDAGSELRVRNRRPGDRIRPLGGAGKRRLKDLLIDRRVPRHLRDRLPLLEIDGRIAWVPGVTIDDRWRIRDESSVWVVEIEESLLPASG